MRSVSFVFVLLFGLQAYGQGTQADYDRANKAAALFNGKVFRDRVQPTWFANDTKFWYRVELPNKQKEFVIVDAVKGTREVVTEDKLPKGKAKQAPEPPEEQFIQQRRGGQSPDGAWNAFIKNNNVWLRNSASKEEVALSTDGKPENSYGRILWSPDSKKLVAIQRKSGGDRRVTLVESAPKEQLQPVTSSYFYLKPGDEIPQPKPKLFHITTKKEVPVSDELFANPWDISNEHWTTDSVQFLFYYNQRGHTVSRIVSLNAETGKATAIINEECKTFFDYANKLYVKYLASTNEMIWMSERDGWNHLYLIDTKTGTVKKQITRGEWVVRGVDRVDEEAREIEFRAMGMNPGEDPYHVHFYRIKFDGTGLVKLTEGDGTHSIQYSPDRKFLIGTYSRVDLPPITELRSTTDGKKILTLETADISALTKTGWRAPERFVAKGRDGKTDIHGVIVRPTNFDAKKSYPVIEYIYAGPHSFFTPKSFRP